MRDDLMTVLDRRAKEWNDAREEMEAGYPKLRARIERFISASEEGKREQLRELLLPATIGFRKGSE